jgi:hypothetical protein
LRQVFKERNTWRAWLSSGPTTFAILTPKTLDHERLPYKEPSARQQIALSLVRLLTRKFSFELLGDLRMSKVTSDVIAISQST